MFFIESVWIVNYFLKKLLKLTRKLDVLEDNLNLYFVDTQRPTVLSFCWIPTVMDFKMCI